MEPTEFGELDVLLHKLREDTQIMEGLSILEQGAIASASETICSVLSGSI